MLGTNHLRLCSHSLATDSIHDEWVGGWINPDIKDGGPLEGDGVIQRGPQLCFSGNSNGPNPHSFPHLGKIDRRVVDGIISTLTLRLLLNLDQA